LRNGTPCQSLLDVYGGFVPCGIGKATERFDTFFHRLDGAKRGITSAAAVRNGVGTGFNFSICRYRHAVGFLQDAPVSTDTLFLIHIGGNMNTTTQQGAGWPSKHDGMPSGGGRDNNPPKK
jgi:hypothetical protein